MTKLATHPHRCVAGFSYMVALCNKLIKQLPCYPSSPSHSPQSQWTDNKKDAPQRRNTSIVSCGDRTRTCDLWVMSPTSYHCSTPRSFVPAKVRRISETTKHLLNTPRPESPLQIRKEGFAMSRQPLQRNGPFTTLRRARG